MATNRPTTEPEEQEGLERPQVRGTLESPERFQQPFVDQRIIRILSIGRYVFCFRQNWQLPMIYGGGSEPLPLTGNIQISELQRDQEVKGKRIPEYIFWGIPADHSNGIKLHYRFLRDQFSYDDPKKIQWLPILLVPQERKFVDDVFVGKDGEITYALSIPNSNFYIDSNSGGNSLVTNYYQNAGILFCTINADGTYAWQAHHYNGDAQEVTKLRANYLATLGTSKKRAVAFGKNGEIKGILEVRPDAKLYDSGIARFFREGQESENLDAVNDLCVNPIDPTEAFITIEGKVHRYRVEDKKLVEKKLFVLPDSMGYVLDFQCDSHGNFAVVLHYDNKEKKGKIAMVNLITGEMVFELKSDVNCAGPLVVSNAGQIFFQEVFTEEKDGEKFERYRMRYLKSNVATFSPGEAARLRDREAEIAERVRQGLEASGVSGLLASLPAAKRREVRRGKSIQVAAAEETLDTQLAAFVAEITGKAEVSAEELREALHRVITLSRQPDYALFGSIFKKHIDALHKAQEKARAREIAKELEALGTAEPQGNGAGNGGALALFERLDREFTHAEALIREMGKLDEGNRVAVPVELASRREGIRARISALREQTASELSARIEENLTKLRELIGTIDEAFVLETVWKGELVKSIDSDIRALPDVARQLTFAEQLKGIFDERRETIRALEQERQAAREAELKMFEKKAELELSEIRSQLMVLLDENAIQAFKLTSPTVTAFEETLKKLPPERAHFMRVKLEDIFASAIATLEARKNVREFEGDVVAFGKVKFPRFKPEIEDKQETWRLSPVRTQTGEILLELRSNLDRIAEIPDEILLNPERPLLMSRDDYKRLMADASSYLHTFVKDHPELIPQKSKRNVPEMSPKWEYSEHVERNLEEFAESLAIQRRNQEGITILEGEAGTGKNVLIDMFAHHTNREVFMFTCNAKTDKEDLTRFYDYDPVRGTYRLNSRVIEAITTPGAILVLDEINTLPPEVAKMLNTLLDYRRTLFPSEGGRFGKTEGFKADPEVLICGTMNPQNYAGVQKLSPEIVSRSAVCRIDYPAMQDEAGRCRVDEVLLYRKYLPQLAAFTREQFITMWHAVINNVNRKAIEALLTPEIETLLRDLKILLVTANKFRKAYMDYKLGKDMEELDFVFSLREGANIVQRYAYSGADIKGAIRKVVLPKIWDEQQRQKVDTDIIAQV